MAAKDNTSRLQPPAVSNFLVHDAEVCEYAAEMSLELRNICKNSGQTYLAYLLEIVFSEANDASSRARIRQHDSLQK